MYMIGMNRNFLFNDGRYFSTKWWFYFNNSFFHYRERDKIS